MAYMERGQQAEVLKEIPQFSIKYKDVFSIKNLYIMMHELLLEEGWLGWEGSEGNEGHQDIETLYSENVYQRGVHTGGKEMWLWWRAKKHWEGRRSDYFLNTLNIDWHVVYLKDTEVLHQGKKMNVQAGEIEVFFTPRIMSDIGLKWHHHPILRHFKEIYEERILHHQLEKREKELWRDVYRLQAKFKTFLKMKTWLPSTTDFHPGKYGWEQQF